MKRALLEAICALFFLLFIFTGLSKVTTYNTFVWDLGRDPMIGPILAPIVGVMLPIVETIVAVMAFVPRTRKWGLYGCLVLMTVFTIYVRWMLHSPVRHCTCGGVLRDMTWQQHLWFNIGFTILAGIGIYLYKHQAKTLTGTKPRLTQQVPSL